MKALCVVCGKEFETRNATKTCGEECWRVTQVERDRKYKADRQHKAISRKNRTANCAFCGKEFAARGAGKSAAKTCGKVCWKKRNIERSRQWEKTNQEKLEANKEQRNEYSRQGIKAKKIMANCTICGKEFERRDMRRKTCGKECSQERVYRKRGREKTANCTICGKEFTTKKSYRKTCRKECSYAYAHEQQKESGRRRRLANPEKAREQNRRWQQANPEKVKEKNLKWRAANPEKAKEIRRTYMRHRNNYLRHGIQYVVMILNDRLKARIASETPTK